MRKTGLFVYTICVLTAATLAWGCSSSDSESGADGSSPADVVDERESSVDGTGDDSNSSPDGSSGEDAGGDIEPGNDTANDQVDDSAMWACFEDADCNIIQDGPACVLFFCDEEHTCQPGKAEDGAPCTPDDPCFQSGSCLDGECQSEVETVCDDDNPCTIGSCVTGEGCEHLPAEGECNDGSPCTEDDICVAGECIGDEVVCDDENPCTDDSCDELAGCISTDNKAECDDGDSCTVGDVCQSGACAGGENLCECQADDDCLFLIEEDKCVLAVECQQAEPPFTCVVLDEVECEASTTSCAVAACAADTGECDLEPANQGEACDEPLNCVTGGSCEDGLCVGDAVECDDDNGCTLDQCVPGNGCVSEPQIVPCDDSDPCTINDFCTLDGVCLGQDVGCGEVPALGYRLTALSIAEPGFCLPQPNNGCADATAIVNSFVDDDLNDPDSPLVMLGQFDPFDLGGDSSQFFLGPGACNAPDECSFAFQPASMEPVEFGQEGICAAGEGLESPAPCFAVAGGLIDIGVMQIVVPLEDSSVSGTFLSMPWPDGIANGYIRAFLKKQTADAIKVTLPLMPQFLLSEILPAESLETVDGVEGWHFVMEFEATQVEFQ